MPRALARVLVAWGGALAQPPECRLPQEKRLNDPNVVAVEAGFHIIRTLNGG